ncbi:winged helix-turn-helix transcriptional regulator [Streptosporangium sp. NPDC048865]|uniref:winged helix-turn-helix transcriptional regulator n=1 Tax=Streptosporangium sp. NPDC048865 TaxID=3155766 RepID=UPI003438EA13
MRPRRQGRTRRTRTRPSPSYPKWSRRVTGLLERRAYRSNHTRHEYVLTGLGRALRPVIVALAARGDSRLDPSRRAMILVDAATGQEAEPAVVDAATGRRLDSGEEFVFAAGPVASEIMRARYARTPGNGGAGRSRV